MLVLSRNRNESIRIGDVIVTVLRAECGKARLGITAPREVPIHREELLAIPEIAHLHGVPAGAFPPAKAG